MSTMHLDATGAHYRENMGESGKGGRQGGDRGHKGPVHQENNEMRQQGAHVRIRTGLAVRVSRSARRCCCRSEERVVVSPPRSGSPVWCR